MKAITEAFAHGGGDQMFNRRIRRGVTRLFPGSEAISTR